MIDFPNSPSVGQTFTPAGSNQTWIWDGTKWLVSGASGGSSIYLPLTGGTLTGPLTAQAPGSVLDNVTIGGVTPKPGSFTALQATSLNGGPFGQRNKILNGSFRVDQRGQASVGAVVLSGTAYFTDRWAGSCSQPSKLQAQTVQGTMSPYGTGGWCSAWAATPYTPAAAETFVLMQPIEGLNCVDLAWGTAQAKPVTLSFLFYSSLTGTHSGSLINKAGNRCYVFSWSCPTANVWQPVAITIPGDTAGTWAIDNTLGVNLRFNLGSGSTYLGTAGAWGGTNFVGATGSVQVVAGAVNSSFNVGNVQLEAGPVATPFEWRSIGQELALCQRYYFRLVGASQGAIFASGYYGAAGAFAAMAVSYPVPLRATPTPVFIGTWVTSNINGLTIDNGYGATLARIYGTFAALGGGSFNSPAGGGFEASAEL